MIQFLLKLRFINLKVKIKNEVIYNNEYEIHEKSIYFNYNFLSSVIH